MQAERAVTGRAWEKSEFFHSDLRREFVEDRLTNEGDFLLRRSRDGKRIVVSVLWKRQYRHCTPIERQEGSITYYSFGVFEFASVEELIAFHFKRHVPLGDELQTILLKPIRSPKTKYEESDIEIVKKIGGGNFGDVFKVRIKSENIFAAMKTLKNDVNQAARDSFQKELDMMKSMQHENIVRYIGTVVAETGSKELKILLELINQGSLERLLRKSKVTAQGKIKACIQVAYGLRYLHKHHIIHRDLAARNILMHMSEDGGITAKVSDFGLSRYDEDGRGYELRNAQKLPLKQMAPEYFERRTWTMQSDVWGFGILMWEVFSNGEDPYPEHIIPNTPAVISKHIVAGNHPDRPEGVNNEIWTIMLNCWKKDPRERSTTDEIVKDLERAYENACKQAPASTVSSEDVSVSAR